MGMEEQFKVFAIIMVALTLMQVIIGLAVLRKYKGIKGREAVDNRITVRDNAVPV